MKELTHLVAANNPPLGARSYTTAVPNMNVFGLQRNVGSTKHVLQLQVVYRTGTDLLESQLQQSHAWIYGHAAM